MKIFILTLLCTLSLSRAVHAEITCIAGNSRNLVHDINLEQMFEVVEHPNNNSGMVIVNYPVENMHIIDMYYFLDLPIEVIENPRLVIEGEAKPDINVGGVFFEGQTDLMAFATLYSTQINVQFQCRR